MPSTPLDTTSPPVHAALVRAVAVLDLGVDLLVQPVPAGHLPGPLPPDGWARLLGRIRAERMTGLLVRAVDGGALPATADQTEEAHRAHVEQMTLCLRLERLLLDVASLLERAGIGHRVLKGPAFAHLDHPDPSLRSFVDVDLLVRSEQFDDAARALQDAGLTRRFPEPRPGFDRQVGKGGSFTTPQGLAVDLHRTLVFGPFGLTIHLDDLWSTPTAFPLGGRHLLAPNAEARLLHACLHAVLGDVPPRLAPLRDVAVLSTGGDPGAAAEMATRWRVAAVVQEAHASVKRVLGADAPRLGAWAAELRPTPLERRLLGLCLNPRASYATKTLASVVVAPGFATKLTMLRALAMPERAYLGARHGSHRERWGAGWRQIARSGRARRARQ